MQHVMQQQFQVLAAVGDQSPTKSSDQVLASLHGSLSRAEALLAFILRPYGFSRRWIPLPVSSKLLREVTEIAADISEKLEEGGDALMDLLPVGVSMIINSGAARACWRKWLGAHAISGSKKKMKACLAVELSKAHDAYSSIHTQLCQSASHAAAPTAPAGVPPSPVPIPAHVVDAAAEALCQMSVCAQAPDEVDVSMPVSISLSLSFFIPSSTVLPFNHRAAGRPPLPPGGLILRNMVTGTSMEYGIPSDRAHGAGGRSAGGCRTCHLTRACKPEVSAWDVRLKISVPSLLQKQNLEVPRT
jgi:hypothetical protein